MTVSNADSQEGENSRWFLLVLLRSACWLLLGLVVLTGLLVLGGAIYYTANDATASSPLYDLATRNPKPG